jgi:hypothetical protein
MVNDPNIVPTEVEEMARRRVWARVQLGMAADRRRRIRQASLAGMAGGLAIGIVTLLLIL